MQVVKILVPRIGLFPLDYAVAGDHELKIGDLVVVPFRNQEITGIVWQVNCSKSQQKLKVIDLEKTKFPANIGQGQIDLIRKTSSYYLAELGTIAKLVLPVNINENPLITTKTIMPEKFNLATLTSSQQQTLQQIDICNKPLVIKGVTGSGKTEIYFHAIARHLQKGQQALIMLPEIALGRQIIERFIERFGFEPAIWNSNVTKAQKKRILRGIISGEVKVVIGARSSLFLPYKNLGIIVIDEEHDQSYKQDQGILYHARDMAVLRSFIAKSKILLVSATPSIETIHNANIGKYELIELDSRYGSAILPSIEIIDMKKEKLAIDSWLSEPLIAAIKNNLSKGEQSLLFLNRRGYAPLMLCKSCGHRFDCYACSASMVVHKSSSRMQCHHCGVFSKIHTDCPQCDAKNSLKLCGSGIEKIAEEAKEIFKDKKIAIFSKDQTSNTEESLSLLQNMIEGKIDILIGTQIITKGYHFPNLTLVGVIDADIGFMGGDLRSNEKTYQLLHQVGGRAGRADKKGKVMIQTYLPDNGLITALEKGETDRFIKTEIENRKLANTPPFSRMAVIIFTGKNSQKTLSVAKDFATHAPKSNAKILGPAEALRLKLSGRYRYQILVMAEKNFNLQKYLQLWQQQLQIPSSIQCKIDIDPYNF